MAVTTSVGPGATNLVTGAATATINRLPVLLLPGDVFANRRPDPVLQQLEHSLGLDISVNDCLRPVSKLWDRITRPEQILRALPEALRVLLDPAETGAVCRPKRLIAPARFSPPARTFSSAAPSAARARAGAGAAQSRQNPPPHRRRRRALQRRRRRPARSGKCHRHPRGDDPSGHGGGACRQPKLARGPRRHRHCLRKRVGRARGRRFVRGHEADGLHDGVKDRSASSTSTSTPPTPTSTRPSPSSPTPARRSTAAASVCPSNIDPTDVTQCTGGSRSFNRHLQC